MAITQHEGVLTYVDPVGNEHEMYPDVKTDKTLTVDGKAADAKVVGEAIKNAAAKAKTVTQEQYDNMSQEEKESGIYIVPEGEDLTAKNLLYDGSATGLGNNVQDAIDAVNEKVNELSTGEDSSNLASDIIYTDKDGNESNVQAELDAANIKVDNVQNELGNIQDAIDTVNGKLVDSGWEKAYGEYCKFRVKNGICTVVGRGEGDYLLNKGAYKAISTIPEYARPDIAIFFAATAMGGTAEVFGRVETDGIVYLYSNVDSTNYWTYTVSFPTK